MSPVLRKNARVASEILNERLKKIASSIRFAREQNPEVRFLPTDHVNKGQSFKSRLRPLKETTANFVRHVPLLNNAATWGWSLLRVRRTARMALSATSRLDALTDAMHSQDAASAQRTDVLSMRVESVSASVENNRVGLTQLAETVARLAQENATLARQLDAARKEIMFQQRRLNRTLEQSPELEQQNVALLSSQALDSYYVAFEDQFRGPRDDVKRRQAPYIERMKLAGVGSTDKPILDVGCGRGEWLELLKENQLSAYGIDINSVMVEQSKSLGLDARCTDLLSHLRSLPDASLSAVTAFHIVEHLPFEVLVSFIDEALRVLISGGLLLFETPNPETVLVGASTFYNDPTHRNPIPPRPLQFMITHRGFSDAEILRLHPFDATARLKGDDDNTARLNDLLFGAQDYAIIARSA